MDGLTTATLLIFVFQSVLVIILIEALRSTMLKQQKISAKLIEREKELANTNNKYQYMFDTMTQGVVYQNKDGNIISANKSALNILGLTMDQLKGTTSMDREWRVLKKMEVRFQAKIVQ